MNSSVMLVVSGEKPPVRRRQMTFMMLPDDLVSNCVARVSRLYYPTLSLVCKRFRSLIASKELYKTRSLLNRTESCIYVCLRASSNSNRSKWFALCLRPNNPMKYGLVPISYPSPSECMSSVASVGSNIYSIGGSIVSSSDVKVMDCRSHTWREAPSMRVSRLSPSICVLDGKIYVTGGSNNIDSTNWMEVFDTKTQTWEFLQIPSMEIFKGSRYTTLRYEGTIFVKSVENDVTYKIHKGRWETADKILNLGLSLSSSFYCEIENVLYHFYESIIMWYNSNEKWWKQLKGFSWPRHSLPQSFVKLVEYNGNMRIFWEETKRFSLGRKKVIWCAEIALERDQEGNIWGALKWSDVVFITNEKIGLVHAVVTTL